MPDNIYIYIYIVLIMLILYACMHIHIYIYTYTYTFPSKGIGGFVHLCIDIQRLTAHIIFKSQVHLLRLPDHFV